MTKSVSRFSRFIIYVDESGDHGPVSSEFPVFVLAFCIFDKCRLRERRHLAHAPREVQSLRARRCGAA